MRVLLSGFEAFGGDAVNPTARLMDVVKANPSEFLTEGEVRAVTLPVTFADCFGVLASEIRAFDPDVVMAFGLAAGRSDSIEIERVAINCIDAPIADNQGARPTETSIDPGGANAHFATLPLRTLVTALTAVEIPAKISSSAGTYVCNYLFYRLLEMNLRTRRRAGFVHVPYLPEQVAGRLPPVPSMSFERLELALKTMLSAL